MSITRFTRDRSASASGLFVALGSAATFGTSGTFADSLMNTGWTPGAVVTFRIVIAALALTVPAVLSLRGQWSLLWRSRVSVLAFGGVAVAGCQLCYFNAVRHLDVGVALLLEYSGILLVVVWMWARHGNRPRRLTIVGGVAALIGLGLVLNPGTSGVDALGAMWGLLAACGLAVYFVLSARAESSLPPLALAWAALVVGAMMLVVLDVTRVVPFATSARDVALFGHRTSRVVPIAGLALIATAAAYVLGIAAARALGPKLASFVGLTEVLFAVLIAWALLDQAPAALQLLGGIVVLTGITLVRIDESTPSGAMIESELLAPDGADMVGR